MKFRIVESRGVFYPERKRFLFWRRFKHLPTPTGVSVSSGADGYGAFNVEGARAMIAMLVERGTDVIHDA